MNKYHVIVSGRVIKDYEVDADCREDAIVEALEYFNEFATRDFTDCDSVSDVFIDVKQVQDEEIDDDNIDEE